MRGPDNGADLVAFKLPRLQTPRPRSPIEPPAAAAAAGRPSPRSGRSVGAEFSVTATGVPVTRAAQAERVAHAEKVCVPAPLCHLRAALCDTRFDLSTTRNARCMSNANARWNPRCDTTHAGLMRVPRSMAPTPLRAALAASTLQ